MHTNTNRPKALKESAPVPSKKPSATPLYDLFEMRSVLLLASLSVGIVGSAFAQSTATSEPAAQDEQVQAVFARADKNRDGQLSLKEAEGLPAVAAEFARIDLDGSKSIGLDEFAKAVKL